VNKNKLLFSIITILFGLFLIVFGGADDSPGAQLLGLVIIAINIAIIIKNKRTLKPKP
jgi:hypothetical protein